MNDAHVVLAVLGIPLAAAACLACVRPSHVSRSLNVGLSFLTFAATLVLAARTVENGPSFAFGRAFFVDPLNVYLVALTAFVGWTTSLFSRPYMQIEEARGRMTTARMRLYH